MSQPNIVVERLVKAYTVLVARKYSVPQKSESISKKHPRQMPEQTISLRFLLAYLKIFSQVLRCLNSSIIHFSKSFTFAKQMVFKILYLHKVAENY